MKLYELYIQHRMIALQTEVNLMAADKIPLAEIKKYAVSTHKTIMRLPISQKVDKEKRDAVREEAYTLEVTAYYKVDNEGTIGYIYHTPKGRYYTSDSPAAHITPVRELSMFFDPKPLVPSLKDPNAFDPSLLP